MNKTKVALGVISTLAVAWVAGSWYTGKKIENNIGQVTYKVNQAIASAVKDEIDEAYLPKLALISFDRGVFSSVVNYGITENSIDNNEVVFKVNISHGPFPFAALKQGVFLPKAASLDIEFTQLNKDPAINEIMGPNPISFTSLLNYDGSSHTSIKMVPLDISQYGVTAKVSGLSATFDIPSDFSNISTHFNLDLFRMGQESSFVELKGLSADGNFTNSSVNLLLLGQQNARFDYFKVVNPKEKYNINIEDLEFNSDTTETNKLLNNASSLSIGLVNVNDMELGSGAVKLNFNNIDPNILQFLSNLGLIVELAGDERVMPYIDGFLKAAPSISIPSFSWKNSSGESTFSSSLQLNSVDLQQIENNQSADIDKLIELLVKSFTLDANISKPMLIELMALSAILNRETDDKTKAITEIKKQLPDLLANSIFANIIQVNDQSITSKVSFVDRKMMVNGKSTGLAEFIQSYLQPQYQPEPTTVPSDIQNW